MGKASRPYEGEDVMRLLEAINDESIISDELTKGRIRTIFAQVKYGQKSPQEIAEYYEIPVGLVRDIGSGRVFRNIIKDMEE